MTEPTAAPTDGRLDLRRVLAEGELALRGQFVNASNTTTLVQVGDPELGVLAVYKPRAGERPLWDFPTGSLHRREVAAYLVSEFLGWQVVPPTLLRDGPLGPGSVQLYVPHDPQRHYFALAREGSHADALARMAAFDLLVNNADRKASHVLLDGEGHLWGCDHGLTFHEHAKLRTVIWDLAGYPLRVGWRRDAERLRAALTEPDGPLVTGLSRLLSPDEVAMLARRAAALRHRRALPDPPEDERPYPWPPL